jgi:hypothetical protein
MDRRRVAALSCALMMIGALTACSHRNTGSRSGLTTAGSDSAAPTLTLDATLPPGPNPSPVLTPTPGTATPSGGHATTKGTHTSSKPTHTPTSSPPSTSAGPDDTDYAIAWSNADCHWFINDDGTAYFSATMYVTANVLHTTGTIKALASNNAGGIPTGGEIDPAQYIVPPTHTIRFETFAAAANFQSHAITFTANLTFIDVPDQLAGDNSSSLLVTFPSKLPPVGAGENLVCSHVTNP